MAPLQRMNWIVKNGVSSRQYFLPQRLFEGKLIWQDGAWSSLGIAKDQRHVSSVFLRLFSPKTLFFDSDAIIISIYSFFKKYLASEWSLIIIRTSSLCVFFSNNRIKLWWQDCHSSNLISTYFTSDDIENPLKNFIFLTVAMQEDMAKTFPLVDVLPWNHFGRKNIGYIYAIHHGAQIIWDFDDDNILLTKHHMFELSPGASSIQKKIESNSTIQIPLANPLFVVLEAINYSEKKMLSFNPYPLMDCPTKPCKYLHVLGNASYTQPSFKSWATWSTLAIILSK